MPYYAIVFNQDRPKGTAPDPQFDCFAGHLFSLTGVTPDRAKVPDYFDIVELPQAPDFTREVWDVESRGFIPRASESAKPVKGKRVTAK